MILKNKKNILIIIFIAVAMYFVLSFNDHNFKRAVDACLAGSQKLSESKITDLNEENKKIISSHPPDIIFVYSARSAESFVEIVKKHSLYPLMTGSKVMCISKKVADIFTNNNWKKINIFNPGDEILQLEEKN